MFTTEREATQKLCVVKVAAAMQLSQVERNAATISHAINCAGSACMQWRFRTPEPGSPGNQNGTTERKGYCGLAGSPVVIL